MTETAREALTTMNAAQRRSVDIAMQLIRDTGTCAINEEDFAALYHETERLALEREEIAYQLHGGTDPDGPVRGLDGLDLSSVANVLHSMAARSEVLEAAIKEHRSDTMRPGGNPFGATPADERLWDVIDDPA